MTEIEARLEALENRPAPILKSAPAADTPTTQIPFPKTALITAAEGRQKQGGFFKRQMDKHIRVKDANDPLVLIEAIETALSENDMDTAKAKFDQLPSQIRSAGQSWRESLN
jgi:hypothetical protein